MDKRGIEINEVLLWIITIAALVLIMVGIIILRRGGESIIDKIIRLFRFG